MQNDIAKFGHQFNGTFWHFELSVYLLSLIFDIGQSLFGAQKLELRVYM
jgi:hypothetical protein